MGIWDSIELGAQSLDVHGKRLDIHARNIANIDTPNYVRKIPLINSKDDISFTNVLGTLKDKTFSSSSQPPFLSGGVSFGGIVEDPTLGDKIYQPGHPDADANGYIRSSNVNPMVDMADAMMAQRAYEANLAIISITKAMAQRAVEIGK